MFDKDTCRAIRRGAVIDWDAHKDEIIDAINNKRETWQQVADRLGVNMGTLRSCAVRNAWPIHTNMRRAARKAAKAVLARAEADWGTRGEEIREAAFQLAFKELNRKKTLPIRNWKDAELADKMARRAAGLENDDGMKLALIHINDRIAAHADEVEDLTALDDTAIDGELVSVEHQAEERADDVSEGDAE